MDMTACRDSADCKVSMTSFWNFTEQMNIVLLKDIPIFWDVMLVVERHVGLKIHSHNFHAQIFQCD